MHRLKWLGAAVVIGCGIALATRASAQAVIGNGTVELGVFTNGELGVDSATSTSVGGELGTGVSYDKPGVGRFEYTYAGCICEGWGVGADGVGGGADRAVFGAGGAGITPISFVSTATDATVVTGLTGTGVTVTQFYHPSASPNLYVDDVTITNGGPPVADLRYTRLMDWDIDPTQFDELVTIGGLPATAVLHTDDNGFSSPNPYAGRSEIVAGTTNTNFVRSGPADHGADFDFGFGPLGTGESKTFQIFYGGTSSVSDAFAALAAVKAEVYSFGEPDLTRVPEGSDNYTVAIFGFKGVGGVPVTGVPEPGALAMLLGFGVSGSAFLLRRKRG